MGEMMVRLLLPILGVAFAACGLLYWGRVAVTNHDLRGSAGHELSIIVDFGVLRRGESAGHRCWLRNSTPTPLAIAKFKSSCECVSIASETQIIAPGERTLVTVLFHDDDEFSGSLQVPVTIQGDQGESIGKIIVAVEVVTAGEMFH